MIYLIVVFLPFTAAASSQLMVTAKNNARYNIAGYSSFKSYTSKVEGLFSNEIRDTYNFALKFNNTTPSVLLSRTSPERLLFLQFLHTFDVRNSNFTEFLILLSSKWSFQPNSFQNFLESNFVFPPDRIYHIIKFVANQKPELPKAVSGLLFFLNMKYKVFEKAATTGDSEVVKWLLMHGKWSENDIDPKVVEEVWKKSKVEILKLLMEFSKLNFRNIPQGIVNKQFGNNETLLHLASRSGYADTVELLTAKLGGNIESKDVTGKTPLYRAVEENKYKVVETLVSKGADIIIEPLVALAVQRGYTETVKTLVNLNAPLDLKDKNGETPFFIAVKRNNTKILEMLANAKGLNRSLLHSTNEFGDTLLHVAASEGFLDSVESLVKLGIAVNSINNFGETPLYKAVGSENLDVIKFLLGAGADLKLQTDIGDTVMHLAASLGNIEIVRFLFTEKIGFSLNTMNTFGETPPYKAALSGKCEMLKFLMDNGGNINIRSDGFTMLHTAAAEGNERAVICLIENGMNVDVNGLWNITPLNLAASQGQLRVVEILLSRKANPNAKTKNNWTPLHRAAFNGHVNIIRLLHKYNADINAKNDKGLNPLLLAVKKQQVDAATLLRSLYPDAVST